jgi:hypothetical protein
VQSTSLQAQTTDRRQQHDMSAGNVTAQDLASDPEEGSRSHDIVSNMLNTLKHQGLPHAIAFATGYKDAIDMMPSL